MREKLIELVDNARMNALWHNAKKPSEYITDMLIADGVTIPVLCKDCCNCTKSMWCNLLMMDTKENNFCSYGERRDNG